MRFNFKKISAIAISTLMTGMTMGVAAAASYPAPFVSGGVADTAIVYGTGQGVSALDQQYAGNIQTDLKKYISSTGGSVTIEGESVGISAPGNDLLYGEALSTVKEKITSSNLPTLLADGKIRTGSKTIDYEQWVEIGAHGVAFDDLNDEENYVINTDLANDLRPVLHLNTTSGIAWTFVVKFDEEFNASNVRDGEVLTIAGRDYTVAKDLAIGDDLILYASSETTLVNVGEEQTVTVGGKTYTIEVIGANTDADTATIVINGKQLQVEEGDTEWVGDQKFYINRVFMQTVPISTASVEIFVGAEELNLGVAGAAFTGVELNDEDVDGMTVRITGTTGSSIKDITKIEFQFTPADLDLDTDEALYLEMGESVYDPVFGTIGLVFESTSMNFMDSEKENIGFKRSGQNLQLTFKNRDGNAYTLVPIQDNKTNAPYIQWHSDFYANNTKALAKNNVIVMQEGTSTKNFITRVAKVTSVKDDEIIFRDESTGATTTRKDGERIWSTTTTAGAAGAYACNNVTLTYNMTSVPTAITSTVLEGWFLGKTASCAYNTTSDVPNTTEQAIATASTKYLYNITNLYTESNAMIVLDYTKNGKYLNVTEQYDETPSFNVSFVGDADAKGEFDIALKTDYLNGGADDEGENAYYLSAWGTYAEADLENDDKVNLYIPSEEVTYGVYIASSDAVVSEGSTSSGAILVTDAEVASVSSKNLIIVGGSCINTAAAKVLGFSGPTCGAAFTAETGVGSGQFLIKSVSGAYTSGKVALVVAGYDAADTVNGVQYLINKKPDTSKNYKGTSATVAEEIVTSA